MITIIKEDSYIVTVLDIPDNLIISDIIEDYRTKVLNIVEKEFPKFKAKEDMLEIINRAYKGNFIDDIQEDIKLYILHNEFITFNDIINMFHIADLVSSESLVNFLETNGAKKIKYSTYNLIDDNYFYDDTFEFIDTMFKELNNYLLLNDIPEDIRTDINDKLYNKKFNSILNTYPDIK